MCNRMRVIQIGEAVRRELRFELAPDACGREWIREQHGAEPDVSSARCNEIERVLAGLDAAHAHDRQAGCLVARVDGCQCDGPQRGSGEAACARFQHGSERSVVQLETADRVDEREPVGAGRLDRPRGLRDVPRCRRKLGVER